MESADIVDLRGIATLLKVSKHTPNQWRQRGILPQPDFDLLRPVWKKSTIIRWAQDTGRWPPGEAARPSADKPKNSKSHPVSKSAKRANGGTKGFRTAEERGAEIPPAIFRSPPIEPVAA